jgi:flavodoxin
MARMLIVYYSWSNGNTRRIAEALRAATDADVERIETVEPYPDDYDTTVAQAKGEVDAGFEPELQPLDLDPADYDVIAIGTPTWWYTMAPAVRSLADACDWHGKTVVPFMTCGGWPGHVVDDMGEACEGASVIEPLEVTFDSAGGDEMRTSQAELDAWAARVALHLA